MGKRWITAVAAVVAMAVCVVGFPLLPAAAAPPPDLFKTNDLEVMDEPALPAWVTFAGQQTMFTSQTLEGVIADEFGHGQQRFDADRMSTVERYSQPVSNVDRAVLGDVDGTSRASGDMDAVAVSGSTLRVLGPQDHSYPLRATATLPAGHGAVVGTAIVPGAASSAPTILVITTTAVLRYKVSGATLALQGSSTGDLPPAQAGVTPLPLANLLDAYQRPVWDHYELERDNAADLVAVVGRSPVGNQLLVHFLRWNPATNAFAPDGTWRELKVELGATSPSSVTSAQIRYDQDTQDLDSDGGQIDFPFAVLHTVGGDPTPKLSMGRSGSTSATTVTTEDACGAGLSGPTPDLAFEANDLSPMTSGSAKQGAYAAACVTRTSATTARLDVRQIFHLARSTSSATEEFRTSNTEVLTLPGSIGAPAVRLTFPCAGWLTLRDSVGSFQPSDPLEDPIPQSWRCENGVNTKSRFTRPSTVAAHVVVPNDAGELVVANRSWEVPPICFTPLFGDPACGPQANGSRLASNQRVAEDLLPFDGNRRPLLLPVNPERWTVDVRITDRNGELIEFQDPTPIALLIAPPTVAGANQEVAAPEFARTQGSSTGSSVSSSNSIGFTVGVDWEDPSGAFAVGAEVGLEFGFTEAREASKSVEITDFYEGRSDEHTIVYRTQLARQLKGNVVGSSTGVSYTGPDPTRRIPVMVPEGVVTTARTLSSFEQQFGDLYGDIETSLTSALPGSIGNPGSYLAPSGIDDYCIGELEGDGGVDETLSSPQLPENPFMSNPVEQAGPDILVGDRRLVTVGEGGSVVTGSGFDISEEEAESRAAESTLSASVSATIGYASLGVNFAHTWGADSSASINEGVSFSAGVGSIEEVSPLLADEGYGWSSFLCKRDIGGPLGSLPVWVLNYTVDDYDGSGGLEPLEDVTLTEPIESEIATRTPSFEWEQDSGTVESYDLELEAIGSNDAREASGLATADSIADASDRGSVTVDWAEVLSSMSASDQGDLLPNQLYRWRVVSEDLFGNTVVSPYEFFVTDGPPQGVSLSIDPPNPGVGTPVDVTVNHLHIANVTYTYSCDFGDGTPVATVSPATHTYGFPGLYVLKCIVSNDEGSTEVTQTIPVGPNAADDAYTAVEDTVLNVIADEGLLINDSGATAATVGSDLPDHGTVLVRPDGSFRYTPTANYCGPDAFSYGAHGGSTVRPALVTLTVTCVNDAPVPITNNPILLETDEDVPLTGAAPGLRAYFTDVDNVPPALGYAGVRVEKRTNPTSGGTLVLNQTTGAYTYTPGANFCVGLDDDYDEFTVRPFDAGPGGTGPDTRIFVQVSCVPDPPTAVQDPAIALDEDTTKSFRLTDNDTDPDTSVAGLRPVISTPSIRANVTVAPDGTVTYAPLGNVCGTDTFGYRASDGEVLSANEITIQVTITCINDAPTGSPGTATVVEDEAGGVFLEPVTLFDDAEDQTVDITITDGPDHGDLTPFGGGHTYQPDPDFCGTDTVTFEGKDDDGATASSTITITVTCVNDAPESTDDTAVVAEDGTVIVDPLDNDTDVDGPPLTVVVDDAPDDGDLQSNPDGTLTYVPDPNFCGTDELTYHASDGSLSSEPTTVSITISCVNDTPQVVADPPANGTEDTPLTTDPTNNDTDVEGDELTPVIITPPTHGDVEVDDDGTIRYEPDPDFCGTDSYGYAVSDDETQSPEVVVTVTIACVNDSPVAGNDGPTAGGNAYRVDQGGPALTVAAPGVLTNDTDVEGDPLTASIVTQPAHGTVVLNPNGSFTYTPDPAFYGLDSFTYQVSDGHGGTDVGQVTIRVRGGTKMTAEPVVLKLSPTKVWLGTFQARMTDLAGNPVADKPIVFKLGTQAACTANTDSNGVAKCSASILNLLLALLSTPTATFTADDTMLGSSARSVLLKL